MDLTWLLRYLGLAGANVGPRGAADVAWCLRQALRAPKSGAISEARRLALDALVGWCRHADAETRAACHAHGVTDALVDVVVDGVAGSIEKVLAMSALLCLAVPARGQRGADDADSRAYVCGALLRRGLGDLSGGRVAFGV